MLASATCEIDSALAGGLQTLGVSGPSVPQRICRPLRPRRPIDMNRLAAPFAPHATFSASTLDFSAGHCSPSVAGARRLAAGALRGRVREAAPGVALFAPIHYERRYAYPLLVWLHGDGGSERELRQLMPQVSVRNYVGAAARGVAAGGDVDDRGGYAWPQTSGGDRRGGRRRVPVHRAGRAALQRAPAADLSRGPRRGRHDGAAAGAADRRCRLPGADLAERARCRGATARWRA